MAGAAQGQNRGKLAIESKQVSRHYGAHGRLLEITLDIAPSESVFVQGDRGAGKSTLLHLFACGLLPDTGSLSIFGLDVLRQRDQAWRLVTLLPARPGVPFETLPAWRNLALSVELAGKIASREELFGALDRVGLVERALEPTGRFAAMERKRLAVAGILLNPAPLVLLDDPLIDCEETLVRSLIASIVERGAALVVASSSAALRGSCGRAFTLTRGRLAPLATEQ